MATTAPGYDTGADVGRYRGDGVRTRRAFTETKAFYKTSEFIVFVVATIAVLVASFFVKAADGHDDYFAADKAWLYVAILSVGYMVSRGLAKSGSRHHDDA